jgi:hypothetical protein
VQKYKSERRRNCAFCGIEFEIKHGLARYCSKICKHKGQVRNKRARYAAGFTYRKTDNSRYFPKPCLTCSVIMTPKSPRDHLCDQCKHKRPRWREDVVSALLRSCHSRFRDNFDLTREWFEIQWHKQQGLCALSGVPLSRKRHSGAGNIFGTDGTKVSIDRINSDLPYLQNNCRLVCVMANLMRNRLSDQELLRWCQRILDYNHD